MVGDLVYFQKLSRFFQKALFGFESFHFFGKISWYLKSFYDFLKSFLFISFLNFQKTFLFLEKALLNFTVLFWSHKKVLLTTLKRYSWWNFLHSISMLLISLKNHLKNFVVFKKLLTPTKYFCCLKCSSHFRKKFFFFLA